MTTEEMHVLVLGGTGKTGRRVADRLTRLGHRVRLGSRSADPPFSWDDPAGWPAVVDGIDAAYLSYYPDVSFPGAAEAVTGFARAAADAGVRRLVVLSGRGEPEAEPAEDGAPGVRHRHHGAALRDVHPELQRALPARAGARRRHRAARRGGHRAVRGRRGRGRRRGGRADQRRAPGTHLRADRPAAARVRRDRRRAVRARPAGTSPTCRSPRPSTRRPPRPPGCPRRRSNR